MDAIKFEKAIAERETICRTLKEMGFLVHYTRSGRFPVGKYGYSGEIQRAGREMNVKEMEIPCKKNVLSVKHLLFIWNRMNGWSANYVIKRIEQDQMPERALCL